MIFGSLLTCFFARLHSTCTHSCNIDVVNYYSESRIISLIPSPGGIPCHLQSQVCFDNASKWDIESESKSQSEREKILSRLHLVSLPKKLNTRETMKSVPNIPMTIFFHSIWWSLFSSFLYRPLGFNKVNLIRMVLMVEIDFLVTPVLPTVRVHDPKSKFCRRETLIFFILFFSAVKIISCPPTY